MIGNDIVEEGRLDIKLYYRNIYCAEGDEILEQFRMDVVSVVELILEVALVLVAPLLVFLLCESLLDLAQHISIEVFRLHQ